MEELYDIMNIKVNDFLTKKYKDDNYNNITINEIDIFIDNLKTSNKFLNYTSKDCILSHIENFMNKITDSNIKIYIGNINMLIQKYIWIIYWTKMNLLLIL